MNNNKIGPFQPIISFRGLKLKFEQLLNSSNPGLQFQAKQVLDILDANPTLVTGTNSVEVFQSFTNEIDQIMSFLFPSVLTNNEIKAAIYPYSNDYFYASERFKKINSESCTNLSEALQDLYKESKDSIDLLPYVFILNMYYGYNIDFSKPKKILLEDKFGKKKTYRVTFNADFINIYPNSNVVEITPDIVKELLANTENPALWKQYFPDNSWTIEGFSIISMIDTTLDQHIDDFKTHLIQPIDYGFQELIDDFRKIFNIPDLQVGSYRVNGNLLLPPFDRRINTLTIEYGTELKCLDYACDHIQQHLFEDRKVTVIPSIKNYHKQSGGNNLSNILLKKNIKSVILIPVVVNDNLEYIIELAAHNANELNAVNASKLESLMPFILSHAERSLSEYENQISAIIQTQCTSIHPSVQWRFTNEAVLYLEEKNIGGNPVFHEVVFEDILPLFGQIDIVGSSIARNSAIVEDLHTQLQHAKLVFEELFHKEKNDIYRQHIENINSKLVEIDTQFHSDTEQNIHKYFEQSIIPIFKNLLLHESSSISLPTFLETLDKKNQSFYMARKQYDETVNAINKTLASYIELKQIEGQKIFPHYFEMFKTDGIEHNIYVGQSISEHKIYDATVVSKLRMWQLQTMCEMETEYYKAKKEHPVKLDVASLILAYDVPMNIRYRIDEKQFDVDGAYNVRYEMIKKRIDKAHIKNTNERLRQPHKLCVVYSSKEIEQEYLNYFKQLQQRNYIHKEIELLELEELQGAIGLRAIRVSLNQNT